MKSTSRLGVPSAVLIILAAGAAEAQRAAAVHGPASRLHYLNPPPLPPGWTRRPAGRQASAAVVLLKPWTAWRQAPNVRAAIAACMLAVSYRARRVFDLTRDALWRVSGEPRRSTGEIR
jgi:pimeloyl-ACP methyl ester carboxylesterase